MADLPYYIRELEVILEADSHVSQRLFELYNALSPENRNAFVLALIGKVYEQKVMLDRRVGGRP